jgi:site-specific DNA-methyltransferase (adenine-specific)/modification methylase
MSDLPLNRILHGDCIVHMSALPAASVDLVFADPPYNLQLQGELLRPNHTRVDGVDAAWDQFADFAAYDDFTRRWLDAARRILKPDGTIWVIGSYHNIFRVGSIMMDLGFWLLNDVIWHKTNPMPNFRGTRFTNATETLIWAKRARNQKRYTFNYHALKQFNDDKQMPNVWHIPICSGAERLKNGGKKAHPTQKPEALLYRVLLASTRPGDVVLDPFFGTGTTGVVAQKLGRHWIGIEQDAKYVTMAAARIAAIAPADVPDALLHTQSRRALPRVGFPALVAAGYIRVGEALYDRHGAQHAVARADGRLHTRDGAIDTIHKSAARLLGQAAHNGWDYWHVRSADGALHPLDSVRLRYIADHHLDEDT